VGVIFFRRCFASLALLFTMIGALSSVCRAQQAIGTAYESGSAASPVWFTVSNGILAQVFYPSPEVSQSRELEFLVTDGSGFFSEQKNDVRSQVSFLNEGMTVHIQGQDKQGAYSFEQDIVSDPSAPVVRIKTTFHWNQPGLRAFVYFKPAMNGRVDETLAEATNTALFATSGILETPWSALVPNRPFLSASTTLGASGSVSSDPFATALNSSDSAAGPGEVLMSGELPVGEGEEFSVELALAYGVDQGQALKAAQSSLELPFDWVQQNYEAGWIGYLNQLEKNNAGLRFFGESTFARRSAQIIKMLEDKNQPGAIVPSLDGHAVVPHDLYSAAVALLSAGDHATPLDVLHYLEATQKTDGSWTETAATETAAQIAAYPILLTLHLKEQGGYSLKSADLEMARKAAIFIESQDPRAPGGFSPSPLAIEIAALRAMAVLVDDPAYAEVADSWQSRIERWTLAPSGKWGNNYYIPLSPQGTPETPAFLSSTDGEAPMLETSRVDGSFLDLVRYQVRQARDPRVVSTLEIYDSEALGLAQKDGRSDGFQYRRSPLENGFDHSPVQIAERGEYSIQAGQTGKARTELYLLEKTALDTGLLSQSVAQSGAQFEVRFEVACPSVRAHAEDILLHRGLEESHVFDVPRSEP